jgi:GNAT superfamily N-acetyltransferase
MTETALDAYIDAFVQRVRTAAPEDTAIDHPGLVGVSRAGGERLSLLVTDDRAVEQVGALLGNAQRGVITVLPAAVRVGKLLDEKRRWSTKRVTAMVCGDLAAIPPVTLPGGLALAEIAISAGSHRDRVDLVAATTVAVDADPTAAGVSPAQLAADLREMRPAPGLFAAIDVSGAVRATGGFRVSGPDASIFFVNTQHGWRRRGVGRAMTATALHRARLDGAVRACLNASEAGVSIYRSLGFQTAGPIAQFFAS